MRFLFRLFLFVLIFWLVIRILRSITSSRKRVETSEPPQPLRSSVDEGRIEEASFTDITDKTNP